MISKRFDKKCSFVLSLLRYSGILIDYIQSFKLPLSSILVVNRVRGELTRLKCELESDLFRMEMKTTFIDY